jgi:hypothetical protein
MEEKLYGVLCIDEDGVVDFCNVLNYCYRAEPATRKQCKKFIDEFSIEYPNNTYKLFKLKFKEY